MVTARERSDEFHDGSNTWYTINDAVMMGYLWGRAEAAEQMQSLAESALAAKAKSALAGKLGGVRRRKEAQEGWMRIVRRDCRGALASEPKANSSRCDQKNPRSVGRR